MTARLSLRRWAALCALLLVVPLVVLAAQARAATVVVTLSSNGPSPTSVTIKSGDTVTFRNADNVTHRVRRNAGAWSFDQTIAPGASKVTPQFTAAGSYGYEDSFTIALLPQSVNGSISVTAPKPTATRSPTPRPSATRSQTPAPRPSGSASPTPSATATATGFAIIPPIGIATIPPNAPIAAPTPNLAPPMTATPTTTAQAIAYGNQSGLVQSSPHRYGLPMALAFLLAIGVLSLIARLLLSL